MEPLALMRIRTNRGRKDLFVVCAVDADVVGQIRGGHRRWHRARWDGSVYDALARGAVASGIDLTPPVIVKPAHQASSFGISRDSVVMTRRDAIDRARRIWDRFGEPAVCDEFVQGRELRAGFIESRRRVFRVAGIAEWAFPDAERGFTTEASRRSQRARARRATDLPASLRAEIASIAQTAFETLGIRGYGSLDLRVDQFGRVTVLEVNANPGLSAGSPVWAARGLDATVRQIVDAALWA